jgi:adenosyl cobinamide kinase/adenosyl cobinamide phosphate guanylyltransferase
MASYLLIGGARSGKSSWAEKFASRFQQKAFIATAQATDEDMKRRIERHRSNRGEGWRTIEAGKNLYLALVQAADLSECIVIDCITVWTASIMNEESTHDTIIQQWVDPVVDFIKTRSCHIVVVTNEVGMGVHPSHESGRYFQDLLGFVNQRFAQVCENVFFFVAGIPMVVKGTLPNE